MIYELDPSLIVRIWFSKNPNKAINFENKQRLINLRSENPDITISLVYAKKLLSENAVAELLTFCRKHKITLISMEEDVIPYCLDKEEKNLVAIYEQEIESIHDGGNLAAASDIVRWLKPIYSRGIYSDFDTKIHRVTHKEKITVEAPILLNIGSVDLPITAIGLTQKSDFELITLNNDILAVIGDDDQTHEIIKRIQCAIYNTYQYPESYSQLFYQLGVDLSRYLCQDMHFGTVEGFKVASAYLNEHTDAILADQLFKMGANPISIRQQLLNENRLGDIAFCRRQLGLIAPGSFSDSDSDDDWGDDWDDDWDEDVKKAYLDFLSKQYGRQANETDIKAEQEAQFKKLYIASVTHASGPGRVMFSLFGNAGLPLSDIDKKVMPYSFLHYKKLSSLFFSPNGYAAHTPFDVFLKQNAEHKIGVSHDLSWTEEGEKKIVEREKDVAAVTLQRFFRAHKTDHSALHHSSSVINDGSKDGNKPI